MAEEPKTIGSGALDPRVTGSITLTRGTKNHRGSKAKDGTLINDSMEFSVTVTLHEAAPGTVSQSELYDQTVKLLDDAYFDQMGSANSCFQAITEAQK